MKRRMAGALLAGWVAVLSAAASLAATEQRVIAIKGALETTRTELTLGDVADLGPDAPPALSAVPLGPSPWPGQTRRVTLNLIKVRMLSSGFTLDDYVFSGAEACEVSVATEVVPAAKLVEAAQRLVRTRLPGGPSPDGAQAAPDDSSGEGPEVRIDLARPIEGVQVPAGEGALELRAVLPAAAPPLGEVRVEVEVLRNGVLLKRVPVRLIVRVYERVAVARRAVAEGEAFSPLNVAFARREVGQVRAPLVRRWEDLHGQVAAQPLRAGETLAADRLRETERPVVIERNQRVFLVVETRTLRAVTTGKALHRARAGEVVRAANLSTGREVVGVAAEDGTVRVFDGGELHAQLDPR